MKKLFNSNKRLRAFHFDAAPSKVYSPNVYEEDYYKVWEKLGFFQPSNRKNVFSMILPPPNVTGSLHLGHALTITTQDTLSRWKRMCGKEVVWVPGLDHAGIATQAVVEKVLEKGGISRVSFERGKLLEEIWKWKDKKSSIIKTQLRAMGSSVDWTKEYFTLDNAQSKAVSEALLILWNKGLIYRDEALVNWSPQMRSTISDIEVNNIIVEGPTELSLPGYEKPVKFGEIVDIAYKVIGSDEEIVVSTTRVETIAGDVAVAVNPDDKRYQHLWGSVLLNPLNGSEIPLVLDYNVDPNFGTGALKVTPAHDKIDFQIGKSHSLKPLSVISEDGTLINSGTFTGMKKYHARDLMMNVLADKGLLRGTKPHKMAIPICSRSGDVVEQLLKHQWFLKCRGMVEKAILAVNTGKVIISPETHTTNLLNWLENAHDWCISRQLLWGHQFPFYHCEGDGKQLWFPAQSEEDAKEVARNAFSGPVTIVRDTDVLDTWFSSALLPFSGFGWPQKTEELERYYPLDTLVTGNDILLFWVARMLMLGLELTNQVPFKEVLLHGVICDSGGRKMSKSLGNVIEPEDVIKGKKLNELLERIEKAHFSSDEVKRAKEQMVRLYPNGIPECGVDALRFSLLSSNIQNQYVHFNIKDCDGAKRFCNKLWQVCNFTKTWLSKYSINDIEERDIFLYDNNLVYSWILDKFKLTLREVDWSLHSRNFHVSTNTLRNFIHHDLCDVYVESIKPILQRGDNKESAKALGILLFVLESCLKCLSPFMPFISERLYQTLPPAKKGSIMEASFPTVPTLKVSDSRHLERMACALKIVKSINKLKNDFGIKYVNTIWFDSSTDVLDIAEIVETLAKCKLKFEKIDYDSGTYEKEIVDEKACVYINLNEYDLKNKFYEVNTQQLIKIKSQLVKLLKMTSNESYKQSASSETQKIHQEKILKLQLTLQKMDSNIKKKTAKA